MKYVAALTAFMLIAPVAFAQSPFSTTVTVDEIQLKYELAGSGGEKVKVLITMFGRETPAELDAMQVKKI